MFKTLFDLMIGGLTSDRMKLIEDLKQMSLYYAFQKLRTEIYDNTEQRLPLWLLLTKE